MAHGLRNGEIRVVKLDILADEADLHVLFAAAHAIQHLVPFLEVRLRQVELQLAADDFGEIVALQHDRRFIKRLNRKILDDAIGLDIAKQRDLPLEVFIHRTIHADHDHVRCNAGGLQFFDRMLRRLGFVLIRAGEIRHKRYVNVQAVARPNFVTNLTNGFEERLAFDVADRAANLRNDHVRMRRVRNTVDKALDLVGHVRNDLHRFAQIRARALVGQNVPVDLARRKVGKPV